MVDMSHGSQDKGGFRPLPSEEHLRRFALLHLRETIREVTAQYPFEEDESYKLNQLVERALGEPNDIDDESLIMVGSIDNIARLSEKEASP